jgi:hypothetical protein
MPSLPRPNRHPNLVLIGLLALLAYGAALWFLWAPLLGEVVKGQPLGAVVKDYYLGDQLAYMAIIGNVTEGTRAYVEPFTETGRSIYPSGYYWVAGLVGRAFSLTPFFLWNLMGIIATFGLLLAVGAVGRWATGSRWGWMLGPLPVFIGTFQWYLDGHWKSHYGAQAVIWPPFAILFNPGAETPALTLLLLSLLAVAHGSDGASNRPTTWAWVAAGGILAGLTLNVHTYVAMYALVAAVLFFLFSGIFAFWSRSAAFKMLLVGLSAGILSVIVPSNIPLAHLVLALAAVITPLVVVREWRKHVGTFLLTFLGSAAVTSLPILVRVGAQALEPGSFFYLRQRWAAGMDLSLPAPQVLLNSAPLLLLAAAALMSLYRVERVASRRSWAPMLAANVLTTSLLTFNWAWGLNQEPYRFLPYGMTVVAALAAPWLLSNTLSWRSRYWKSMVAFGLLATLPTTVQFARTQRATLRISPGERATLAQVAQHLPAKGSALLDVCLSKPVFKVASSAPVAFFNRGLAIPSRFEKLEEVLALQAKGLLPDNADLQRAGVTSLVTLNYCNGPGPDSLERQFGKPVAELPLKEAASCGMPGDTVFQIYLVEATTSTEEISSSPYLPGDPFLPGPDGGRVPKPGFECAFGRLSF